MKMSGLQERRAKRIAERQALHRLRVKACNIEIRVTRDSILDYLGNLTTKQLVAVYRAASVNFPDRRRDEEQPDLSKY